jgi:LysM domain
MASFLLRAALVALSLTISHAGAQVTSPTHPGIAANCNAWHTVKSGDSCWLIETTYAISHTNFIQWNPAVSNDCSTNFWVGYAYCVAAGAQVSTTPSTTSPTITGSRSSITSSRSSVVTSSSAPIPANATYSIREPITSWNLTSPTIENQFPPQRTQAGQPSYCNNWYYVGTGDTCEIIAGSTIGMTMEDLWVSASTIRSHISG